MLIFIHINKTAGSTVRYILRSSFGLRHCEAEPWPAPETDLPFSAEDLRRLLRLYPNLESIAGHRVKGYVDLRARGTELKYFTFMRDPLKTCASRFQYNVQYRRKKGLVFEEWIQREWTRDHQTKMIAGTADVNDAMRIIREKGIFVGLTDRFDESLILLKSLLANNLNISYRPINVARKNDLAENLLATERTRQMLIEANRADLELYKVVREQLYPGFQRDYGAQLEEAVRDYQLTRDQKFNMWNMTLSRLKQYLLYRPLLHLGRMGIAAV